MSKPFSQQQYDQDDYAKFKIIDFLERTGYKAKVNPDKFGIDILAERWQRPFQFEVEIKHNWTGTQFPFQNVHFSARKRKFVSLDTETWFVMLNHERTHALFISGQDFMDSPIIKKDTKYTEQEWFVEVDIHWAIFRNLQEERK